MARGTFIPGSHSTVEIGEMVLGSLSPQGTTQRAACGTPLPSLSVKEASLLILELQSKSRLQVCQALRGLLTAIKEHRLWVACWCSPSALLQITGISKKTLLYFSVALTFVRASQGNIYRFHGSGGQHRLCLWFHRTVSAYF